MHVCIVLSAPMDSKACCKISGSECMYVLQALKLVRITRMAMAEFLKPCWVWPMLDTNFNPFVLVVYVM